jgi:hypothetical protein
VTKRSEGTVGRGVSYTWAVSLFLLSTGIWAQSLPRVLILDFKNKSGNASLGYLEGSITDAVTTEMKKRFTFAETPAEQWKAVAGKNYFFENDLSTDSAAVNLGLLTSQDVVVTGNIVAGKNASQVTVVVGIFDIGQKKKIEELSLPLALSANMFADIEKIAVKVSDTAASILPNKDEWARKGLGDFTAKLRQHVLFTTSLGVLPFSSNKTTELSERSVVSAESFDLKVNLQLHYEIDQIWKRYLFVWGGGGVEFGSQKFNTSAGDKVSGSMFSWEFTGGAGLRLIERVRWRVSLMTGLGVYMQGVKFDYSSDTVFALNSATLGLESGKSASAMAVTAPLGATFSYRLTPDVSVVAGAIAKARFFQNSQGFSSYFMLGAGYDF